MLNMFRTILTLPDAPGVPRSFQFVHMTDSGLMLRDRYGNVLRNSVISYSAGNAVTLNGSDNAICSETAWFITPIHMANFCSAISVAGSGHTSGADTTQYIPMGGKRFSPNNLPECQRPAQR